ncbi:MAG TPA: hypothetical protein PLI09_01355 [Candidatus Hydrogenedentes bacterium]|nr:hypothetical protein [Candidatus Hydrogenedentota bacterium]
MAAFTSESAVRLKFQVTDTASVPQDLVLKSIEDAHEEIVRCLDPAVDQTSPEETLVLGETLLAGAHLLKSLAAKDAVQHKEVVVGGQRVDTGKRYAALMALSNQSGEQAWETLRPYLRESSGAVEAVVTDTTPVLG